MNHNKACVLFSAIRGFGLVRSRLPLIEQFTARGWHVVIATVEDEYTPQLKATGGRFEPLPFRRGGITPLADLRAFIRLGQLMCDYRPALMHSFHVKPIIFTGLNAYLHSQVKIVSTVTGLGHAFVQGGYLRALSAQGYRLAFRRNQAVIFQNPDDMALFLDQDWIPAHKAELVLASGVDVGQFQPRPDKNTNSEPPQILMVSRLIWQKGVQEFVKAAQIIKQTDIRARFILAGEWDTGHPGGVSKDWVDEQISQGTVEFLGYIEDMPSQLQAADIFLLPSYYPEGVPRVLMEAAACGLPIVTCDVPGCREAIVNGQTGLLVPPRDSRALAAATLKLIHNPEMRRQMGKRGRQLVEERFDIQKVTERYLEVYRGIGIKI